MEHSFGNLRLDIAKVEVLPVSAQIKVTYIVHFENKVFEGVIGGGETQFMNEELGLQLMSLVEKIRAQIEQDLGIAAATDARDETQDEEQL